MESGKGIAKIVAHFRDGRVVKGFTRSFDPNRPEFHLELLDADPAAEPALIELAELKAVFFVRDFRGDPEYNEHKAFSRRPAGRVIEVTFLDGETLLGTSLTYDATRPGFFLFPADPQSNNERVFVIRAATSAVKLVPPDGIQPTQPG